MDHLLDFSGAALVLGIPESTLRHLVAARAVQCTRLGRHVRFSDEDLTAIVAAGRQLPEGAPTRDQVAAVRTATPRRRRAA